MLITMQVLQVIPSDFDVIKLLQFCDGGDADGGGGRAHRGVELLPASEGGAHGRAFPGLIRLGPGVDDGCNLGNAAYIVRHDGAGEGDRQAPRVRRILDALASVPVRNLDGVFNLAMDEIKVYATSRPLAHVA